MCILQVRYDIPKKEYTILNVIAFVSGIDKEGTPIIKPCGFPLQSGDIITPIFLAGAPADSIDSNNAVAIATKSGETAYFKFIAPNGKATASEKFFIDVKYNEVTRYLKDDIE